MTVVVYINKLIIQDHKNPFSGKYIDTTPKYYPLIEDIKYRRQNNILAYI